MLEVIGMWVAVIVGAAVVLFGVMVIWFIIDMDERHDANRPS